MIGRSFLTCSIAVTVITAQAADKLTAPQLIELARQKPHSLVEALGASFGEEKLKKVTESDGQSLLDHTLVLYGSPMGDSNLHNHKRVPIFLAGHAGGALKGHLHLKTPDGTPTANMYITLLRRLGIDAESFGDSTGELTI